MKKSELYKYPRNILVPVILFIIGMLFVFIVYKLNSVNFNETPDIKSPVKMAINTKANFNVETIVKIGDPEKVNKELNFSGNSLINLDLSNGEIFIEELNLQTQSTDLPEIDIKKSLINITLNSSYPSTGNVDLKSGNMDISLDLIINNKSESGSEENQKNIKMTIPLSGSIDRDSGIIKLSGEATIPPRKNNLPLPVSIQVVATTNPETNPKNGNAKDN